MSRWTNAVASAAGPAEHHREIARSARAEAGAGHARERSDEPPQRGLAAEVLAERGHARRADAAGGAERQDRGERRGRLGREALPGRDRLARLRPRPRDEEVRGARGAMSLQREGGHDAEVAAASAAAGPVE